MIRLFLVAIIVTVLTQKSEAVYRGGKYPWSTRPYNVGGLTRTYGIQDIQREIAETQRALLGGRIPENIHTPAHVSARHGPKDKYGRYITGGHSSQGITRHLPPYVYSYGRNDGDEGRRRFDPTRANPFGNVHRVSIRINPQEEETQKETDPDSSQREYVVISPQRFQEEPERRHEVLTQHIDEREQRWQERFRDIQERRSESARRQQQEARRQAKEEQRKIKEQRRQDKEGRRRGQTNERRPEDHERRSEMPIQPFERTYDRSDRTRDDDHTQSHHESHDGDHHGQDDRHHDSHHDRHHHGEHHHHHHHHEHDHFEPRMGLSEWANRARIGRYGYFNSYGRSTTSPSLRTGLGFVDFIRDRYSPPISQSHGRRGSHGNSNSGSSDSIVEEEEEYRQRKCNRNRKMEQPSYNVTCVSPDGYEVRVYEEAVWITTRVRTTSYEEGGRIGFRRLFSYISGRNSQHVKMNMTKPVRHRVLRRQDHDASGSRYAIHSVSMVLSRQFWNNTPEPLYDEVFFEVESPHVYVYNFSGWAYGRKISVMYTKLQDLLQETDQPRSESEFFVQVYDAPWIVFDRHNEMVIPVDSDHGEPTCGRPSTEGPPTEAPSTEAPSTEVPQTEVPPTEELSTEVPPTEVPPTERLLTEGISTEGLSSEGLSTYGLSTERPSPQDAPNGIRQCLDNECPTYRERSSLSENIVIREVSEGVYATKRSTTCVMSDVMGETYMPLRKYFLGSNSERISIPTTVPILQLGIRPARGPSSCNFTYQTSFYIPTQYQEAPPTPDDETIFISSAEEVTYYVLTFEESPTPNIAFAKYYELVTFLRESDLCFITGQFQLTFYDAPWGSLPHRYEVWIPLDDACGNDVPDYLFPLTEDGNMILPVMNDDPNPVAYTFDKKTRHGDPK